MTIDFNKIPDLNPLYIDYISDFTKLSNFFEYNFNSQDDFKKCILTKKESYNSSDINRTDLSILLHKQNTFFNSSLKTFENIKSLEESNTFAVVTGQQVGILSGPLYTVYKAINTIQLAEKLNYEFSEYKFVPVFWLEADDHDFLEINNINLINKENNLVNVKYFENGTEQEKYLKPVANILIDEFFNSFKNEVSNLLSKTDFSEELENRIDRSYRIGTQLNTAFARFLNSLFDDFGLILFDPTDPEAKSIASPLFKNELNSFPKVCEIVVDTSAKLEQYYEPQIKPKPLNLFYNYNGNRYLLEPKDDSSIGLKNSRQKFTVEELNDSLNADASLFSPNVILRPIVQDYIFPTVAYIAGPSELAYFAQFKGVYNHFDIPMPVIYPRTSVTLIENKVKNFIDKYEITFTDFFNSKELNDKLLKISNVANIDDIFNSYIDEINATNYKMENILELIDKNLTINFKNRNLKNIEGLNPLKQKFLDAQLKQNDVVFKKLKSILVNVYPENKLQERVLNISYFINKYGFNLIRFLKDNIKITGFDHQLIELNLINENNIASNNN
ncbi:MAG TPA: bacillithiol biosynthesis cysteine-adding enzyme BshC [Ignavibacteria bacterium]|nr:bacillithiol biosynthesis cysteine-adding enzyme BshC [Ignavibacteria bacterium]